MLTKGQARAIAYNTKCMAAEISRFKLEYFSAANHFRQLLGLKSLAFELARKEAVQQSNTPENVNCKTGG